VALVALDDAGAFGTFSVAILGYRLALAVSRSLIIEPVLTDERASDLLGGLPAVAVSWGVLVFSPALIIALVGDTSLRRIMIVLFVFGPMLIGEEAVRQVLIARGQVVRACAIEGVWLIVGAALTVTLLSAETFGPASGFAAWAGAGAIAAVVGLSLTGNLSGREPIVGAVRVIRTTFGPLAATTAATRGATQAAGVLVGIVLGLSDFGRLRGAQALVSPAAVLVQGARVSSFRTGSGIDGQIRRTNQIHKAAFGASVAWTTIILVALPVLDPWFPSDKVAAGAVPFEGLTIGLVALSASADLTFRFRGQYATLLKRSMIWIPIPVIVAPAGAWLWGPTGAAAGTAFAVGVLVVLLRRDTPAATVGSTEAE